MSEAPAPNASGASAGASGAAASGSGSGTSVSTSGSMSGGAEQTGSDTGSTTGAATTTGSSGDTSGDSVSTSGADASAGVTSGQTSGSSDADASVPDTSIGSTSGVSSGSSEGGVTPVVGDGGTTGGGGTCATLIPKPKCSGPAGAYHNPAMGNIGTHDPNVVKDNCTFYLFQTNHNMVPSATSTDLINWKSINPPSVIPAWWGGSTEIWAPDVHFANGKFWNYYTLEHPNSNQAAQIKASQIGLATNVTLDPSSPNYKWQDQGLVIDQPTGGGSGVNCIDPDMFIDDDGTWWLSYGSFNNGIRLLQLDPATGMPMKPVAPTSITNHLGEGSSLIKHNGWYYSFVSRGKCCSGTSSAYEIIYGRSKTIKGPYTTKSGQNYTNSAYTDATDALLKVGSDGNTGGEGGQSFFKENGQWYMDYHTYNPGAQGLADLDVRPIYFDSSDWVTFDCSQGTP